MTFQCCDVASTLSQFCYVASILMQYSILECYVNTDIVLYRSVLSIYINVDEHVMFLYCNVDMMPFIMLFDVKMLDRC